MAVNNLITLRKGTSSEWAAANPILSSGEPGYDLTNRILKIGDGTSSWIQLSGTNQNIVAGYDISITSNSGIYTIASTNLVHVDSKQPQGFINRTDSRISVSGNIFTISPTGSSYSFYNQGIKVIKTSGDSLTIPNLTQINYIHFDTINNQLSNKTTGFDFATDIPVAFIAWNSGVSPSGQMTFFAEERHGIMMDTSTHKWIHNTFGAQYVNGLSISNYSTSGNGSSNSDATIAIGDGLLYQEDIEINITDSSSTEPFHQELSPIAQIPVYYHSGTTGQWVKNTATNYPVKYGANGPQYNLNTGGNWTTPDVSPGGARRYFAVWILATNQIDDPIISIMGQRIDSNHGAAENNNSWSDIDLTNLPLNEIKPLYRLIFAGDSDFTNTPKCYLYSVLDLRSTVISSTVGIPQNDHGSLFGLGDDDHSQYVHIDNARTIDANHTFTNGLTSNGLISSSSGNFTQSLQVNGTGVSVSGHTHTSSDISDFNETVDDRVSGLLVGTSGINVSYNDSGNTLTIAYTGTILGSSNNILEYIAPSGFPSSGVSQTIYIATDSSKMYRWTGSVYVEIGPIGGGDTSLWNLFLPGAPTNLTGTIGSSQVNLSWTAPTGVATQTPITDYIIQYSGGGPSTWTTFNDSVSSATSGIVTGLTNGSGYIFRVAGINIIGTGTFSNSSATITPSTGDTYFSNVQLLLHADGTTTSFVDNSNTNRTITANGDATQSATQSKWGGKSAYFDGNGDYLSLPYAASLVPGAGDFVIEGWFYFADLNYRFLMGTPENANGHMMIAINPTASDQIWVGRAGIEWPLQFSGHTLSTNTWNHIAIARNGSSNRLYIGGTQIGSTITNSQNWTLNTNGVWIGNQEAGSSFNGYIDDFRITIGSARLYTGSTITVPTTAFPDY